MVKNRAAYCGVSRRVFERCGVYLNCHGNFGPGDQNSRKIGPPGPLLPENLGPAVE